MLRLRKGVAKFGGKKPNKAAIKLPLRDGDIERDDEAYKGHYFINANSTTAPQIVDRAVKPILDRSEVYSGWNNKLFVTREMTAKFFDVDVRTISRYLEQNGEELSENGYEVLRGKKLKSFLDAARNSGKDINVPTKTTVLGVFDFRAFLNMAMLLSESEKARALRQLMLDVVIDLINRKTGGGTKYINQRDKDFLFSSLQEDNYRRRPSYSNYSDSIFQKCKDFLQLKSRIFLYSFAFSLNMLTYIISVKCAYL